MVRLVWQILGWAWDHLSDFVLDWVVPVLLLLLFLPIAQVLVFIQPWMGAVVLFFVGLLIAYYTGAMRRMLEIVGAIFTPAVVLAMVAVVSPSYFQLLAFLAVVGGLLVLIGIPGLVLSSIRPVLVILLTVEAFLSLLLMGGTIGKALPVLIILAGLALLTSILISWGAMRPWEIRQVRRAAGRWVATLAIFLFMLAFKPAWERPVQQVASAAGQAGVVISATVKSVSEWLTHSPIGWWWRWVAIRAEKSAWGAVQGLVDTRAAGKAALEEEDFLREKRRKEIRAKNRVNS